MRVLVFVIAFFGLMGTEKIEDLVTIITTTHPIPCIPSTLMLERTQRSLQVVPELGACRKIIVFDGVAKNLRYFSRKLKSDELKGMDIQDLVQERYENYKNNVVGLVKSDPVFQNTRLVFCQDHLNLAFAINEALKFVTTPFVFIHQHDFELIRWFDVRSLIQSMQDNSNIKMVRLNMFVNQENGADTFLDSYVEGGSVCPLLRTNHWSDNDHFCSVAYYTDFILPKLGPKTCMEWVLTGEEKGAVAKNITNHLKYGTYLYGNLGDFPYIRHLDGSRNYGDSWEY